MKRLFLPTLLLFFAALEIEAQSLIFPKFDAKPSFQEISHKAIPTPRPKAFGDTLWYEDFDSTGRSANNFLPAGWRRVDFFMGNYDWIWDDGAPGGQFTNVPAINSPSAANGFLSFPGDRYNTPLPANPVGFDAFIETNAISISPSASVLLRFTHSQNYCCLTVNEMNVSVSIDSLNWTDFDATFGNNPNSPTANGELAEINISSVAANSAKVYLRFHWKGPTHYYWMIDDVHLVEGPTNSLQLTDYRPVFDDQYQYNPVYRSMPHALMEPLDFIGTALNYGSNVQTSVQLNVQVNQLRYSNGQSGPGVVHTFNSFAIPTLAPLASNVISFLPFSRYINSSSGDFRSDISLTSAQGNQQADLAIGSFSFSVTDSTLGQASIHDSTFQGSTGSTNFVGGGNDGDLFGSLITMTKAETATSVAFFVSNDNNNIGVKIRPRVWHFYDTAANFATAIIPLASNPFPYTVDSSDLGNWIDIDLFPTVLLQPGQYLVGWEVSSGSAVGLRFLVGRDRAAERFQPAVANILFINNATSGWGSVSEVPAVRLNFNGLKGQNGWPVGLAELEQSNRLKISPNPSKGWFQLQFSHDVSNNYQLKVFDLSGKLVYKSSAPALAGDPFTLDLSFLGSGIYVLQAVNGQEQIHQKLIIE